jgi:hypothetical protein
MCVYVWRRDRSCRHGLGGSGRRFPCVLGHRDTTRDCTCTGRFTLNPQLGNYYVETVFQISTVVIVEGFPQKRHLFVISGRDNIYHRILIRVSSCSPSTVMTLSLDHLQG